MEMKSISTMALITTIALITQNYFTNEVVAQEAQPSASAGMKFVGAGLAFGLAALIVGVAIGGVGAAGLAVISERPELRSQALVFTALPEDMVIYAYCYGYYYIGPSITLIFLSFIRIKKISIYRERK